MEAGRGHRGRGGAFVARHFPRRTPPGGQFQRSAIADRTDAQNARVYNERGAAHSFLGEYDDAIDDYTRAIQLDPVFALAYRNRGSSHAHKGEWEEAVSDYTTAIHLDHNDAKSYLKRSEAYTRLGDRAKSQEDYEEAIQLDPSLKR